MAHDLSGSVPPRFKPGATVRVKDGVRGPDFPDISTGNWAGTVEEVESPYRCPNLRTPWGNRKPDRDYGHWFWNRR